MVRRLAPREVDEPQGRSPTRERVLDVAEQLFADHGFDGTSLRMIALQVGIREPSLYAHFPGKDAIYEAVIDRALSPFSEALLSWSSSVLSLQTLVEMPQRLLQLHAQHPRSAQILHREFTSPKQRIHPKVLAWQKRFVTDVQRFMRGMPEREVDRTKAVANLVTCTNLILGIFSTRGMQQSLLGDAYDEQVMMAEYLRLTTRILKSLVL